MPIAPTGATARTDLVVLRVEDPEYEGTRNPATDDIGYFTVVSNVSSTTTQPPAGMTAIPLARIAIPANTGTVTGAMITDLRSIANPRRTRQIYTASPSGDQNWTGNNGAWAVWPAAASWNIDVPAWAVTARIVMNIAAVQVMTSSVWGQAAFKLGTVQGQSVNFDTGKPDGSERINMISADTLAVPATLRGTTVSLQSLISFNADNPGILQADIATTAVADVEFEEGVI